MAANRHSPRAALFHLLEDATAPVYVIDDSRKIIYCNAALASWLAIDAEELIGQRCDYHSQRDAGDVVNFAGLCPPPSVFNGESASGFISRRDKTGNLKIHTAAFLPLGPEAASCPGVIAVVAVDDQTDEIAVTPVAAARQLAARRLHERILQFRQRYEQEYELGRLIGSSPAIRLVRDRINLATRTPARVVVIGPQGSGREHVARTIHFQTRGTTPPPLVPLDCGLLDAELIETTVTAFLKRCAELETEGVPCLLLLDVDRLPADAQEVLRGFLAVREFDLRTIATARTELSELVHTQDYRADVAAMLSTVTIQVPSLSERLEDIPILLQYFIEELNAAGAHQVEGFSVEAVETLLQYPWPGNVDELIGIIRETHQKSENPLIDVEELPKQIRLGIEADEYPLSEDETVNLDAFLREVERELVQRAVSQARGNKAQAARLLGIPRARLLRRIEHLGIE